MLAGALAVVGIPVLQLATATVATAAEPVPGHTTLVPDTPRADTPVISDGEIWDLEVVGNRVFIAGTFSSIAQPNGGTVVNQRSLAAYNIDTGLVDTTFRPTFGGGGVNAIEASPDGTSLYVAGSFDTVNGVAKAKIARLNLTTGAPFPGFTANAATQATALAVSDTAVYVGGTFGKVNGVTRSSLAALDPVTGAVDPGFDLPLSGGIGVNGVLTVQQLKLTHDYSKLLVLHTGRQIDGQDRYGVGIIDTATKSLLPWKTTLWQDNLGFVGGIMRAYAMDVSPDDSYFVVTSGSGGDRPPINDTAVAFSVAGGSGMQPRWVSRHFDSVYSVAITEQAVYVGGHFSWEESPQAPDPWPGLDNVGYGNGQGLSGYSLGDAVVRRDHISAINPVDGKSLEWNPGSTSYEGVKAMLATPRGLFAGGDGMFQGGVRTGRVAFYDLSRAPAPSAVDTTITAPIEGRVVPADQPTTITGRAVAPNGVTRVQVQIQDRNTSQWLQDNLTTWGAANTIDAVVTSPNATSSSWSLDLTLSGNRELRVLAKALGGGGTSDPVKAEKRFESFGITDATPTTSVSSPGSFVNSTTFTASGTASDDVGVNAISLWFRFGSDQYLQDDGTVAPTFNTFRIDPDVIGAPNATWQYEVTLPREGLWTIGATAIDTAGQSDLRAATRDFTVDSTGLPPQVTITAPVQMTPPTTAPTLTVAPGAPMTFRGTASDEGTLQNVEISLRNSSTKEALAADGTWGPDSISGFYRISPQGIGSSTYNWSYTTPFNLSPGTYTFSVRATDTTGLTTSSSQQGRLTINAQVVDDLFPDALLDFTGVDQNINVSHLDLTGSATDDKGVAAVKVSLRDLDTNRYVQRDGTMASTFAELDATLGTPGGTSTTFTVGVDLPTQGEFSVEARAVDTSNQRDPSTTGATARYLVYPGDTDPWLSDSLGQPVDGAVFDDGRIIVSGRALDDVAMGRVDVAVVNSLGQYMSSSGAFTSTTASYRSAFLNSPGTPGSNYSYTTPVIPAGTYTVKVRAVDGFGQIQQEVAPADPNQPLPVGMTTYPVAKSVTVTVNAAANNPPVAVIAVSCNQNVCAFDGTGSTDENPTSLTYSWNFGNGRTSTSSKPTITYATPATFTVTLTVRDENNTTSVPATTTVTITEPTTNVAPAPVINAPTCSQNVCSFNGAGSADPNAGDTVTWTWDFGDATTATGLQQSHAYAAGGTYTVTLTGVDGWGKSASTSRQVTVSGPPAGNTAPTAAFTSSCTGLSCDFDGSGSTDADAGDTLTYSWSFGDGTAAGTGVGPSHTYATAGTKTVTLTVRDTAGATSSVSHDVDVSAPVQAIAFRASAGKAGNSSTANVTAPAAIRAGDTMLLYVSVNRATTITNPAGWTVVGNQDGTAGDLMTRVWRKTAAATDAGSRIRVPLAASSKFNLTVAAYSGVSATSPVADFRSAAETTSRTDHTTPAVAVGAGGWLLSYWTDKTNSTSDWTPATGQTERTQVIGSGTGRVTSLLADRQGGSGGVTATASAASSKAVMWSLVLNPA